MDDQWLSRLVAATGAAGRGNAALAAAVARARDAPSGSSAVVLVEGVSDQFAVSSLAARRGRNLDEEGVLVVPMGGATNIGHFLDLFGPRGLDVALAGLCDEAEERDFRRGLQQAGLRPGRTRADLERLGFYVCVVDLEDELIRSIGVAAVEQLIVGQGELGRYRTFCRQPAQRNRAQEQRLRRFIGTRSGGKIQYGRVLAKAVDLTRVPRPLDRVLAHV